MRSWKRKQGGKTGLIPLHKAYMCLQCEKSEKKKQIMFFCANFNFWNKDCRYHGRSYFFFLFFFPGRPQGGVTGAVFQNPWQMHWGWWNVEEFFFLFSFDSLKLCFGCCRNGCFPETVRIDFEPFGDNRNKEIYILRTILFNAVFKSVWGIFL